MHALLIVDLQNDFLPGGALGVNGGDEIIPMINELQEKFALIVATKDWHPPHHVSFAKKHGKQPGEVIEWEGMSQELWPVHCVQNTPGAEFSPALHTERIEKTFYKGIDEGVDSYSAFFDNAHKRSTGLGEYLKKRGVDELTIVGLTTDVCVRLSALDAVALGFKTHVNLAACRSIGNAAPAIAAMKKAGVFVESIN